jgi:hypothetical protein
MDKMVVVIWLRGASATTVSTRSAPNLGNQKQMYCIKREEAWREEYFELRRDVNPGAILLNMKKYWAMMVKVTVL